MSGADDAGDDFEVGRTNKSGERSLLVATSDDPDGYQTDFVLDVSIENGKVLTKNPDGVDAIHATGTESLATGGFIGTIPEGNGVVGRGLNGVVGYTHAAVRNKILERDVHAGVLGDGGPASPGVFGDGSVGVVGYGDAAVRDSAWEAAESTGVAGSALGVGVRGKGDNGGVRGESANSAGVEGLSELAPGVRGFSTEGSGVLGESKTGDGVTGLSATGVGGVFESKRQAQVWLVPTTTLSMNSTFPITPQAVNVADKGPPLPRHGKTGQLMTALQPSGTCTLWLCVSDGPPAMWAQVLVGDTFAGSA
jgi:hypothetical protein